MYYPLSNMKMVVKVKKIYYLNEFVMILREKPR